MPSPVLTCWSTVQPGRVNGVAIVTASDSDPRFDPIPNINPRTRSSTAISAKKLLLVLDFQLQHAARVLVQRVCVLTQRTCRLEGSRSSGGEPDEAAEEAEGEEEEEEGEENEEEEGEDGGWERLHAWHWIGLQDTRGPRPRPPLARARFRDARPRATLDLALDPRHRARSSTL
eukprot:3218737-Rhodomonas_salina.1